MNKKIPPLLVIQIKLSIPKNISLMHPYLLRRIVSNLPLRQGRTIEELTCSHRLRERIQTYGLPNT